MADTDDKLPAVAWLETFHEEGGGKETMVWLIEPKRGESTISIEPLGVISDVTSLKARIQVLSNLLTESRDALGEAAGDYHWTPKPGFLARIDAALGEGK